MAQRLKSPKLKQDRLAHVHDMQAEPWHGLKRITRFATQMHSTQLRYIRTPKLYTLWCVAALAAMATLTVGIAYGIFGNRVLPRR